ncbi:MAG: hypothetical protein OEV89_12450 [Desulfobulbaceae bacterium]|nr:hypothetical protein [Desulfobulbaceae bacterium]HIJ91472.1 hypothetical protein [Deltaproteobacteria bacterium]
MAISGIQSGQEVYRTPFAQESSMRPSEPSIVRYTESDTVLISEEAKELAKKDYPEKNQGKIATGQMDAAIQDKDLPLEALSLPSWYGNYVPNAMTVTHSISHEFWDMVGELTKDNSLSDEDRSQIKNYLQNDPIHQVNLAKDEFRRQFKNEISEYMDSIGKYFQESLKENGVNSNSDYYKKVVLDKDNSEKVHQSMQKRIESDPRLLELAEILGIKLNS